MNRIHTIDITRGLVMVIMALDHVRDLLHTPALTQDPTDLSTTTTPLFLTRWITHLCAPTFVFLSGTSAYLSLSRRNAADRRFWLFKRGLVLLVLELTLINFAFWTDPQFRTLMLQVIFVIGVGLMILSGMAKLPIRWLAGIGLGIVFLHDLLLLVPPFSNPVTQLIWSILFKTQLFPSSPQFMLLVAYPVVPWFGIMLIGYACGPVLSQPVELRKQQILRSGMALLGAFLLIRFLNVYGDAAPWSVQPNGLFTVLSFVNVSKYPPSLQYTLLTLGIMFVILWAVDGVRNPLTRWLTVYGKVPLFYYLVHWYL